MTRKHFEALAAALRDQKPNEVDYNLEVSHGAAEYSSASGQWLGCVQATADVCARFNPRFDRTRFLKACGVEEGK